MLFGGRGVVWRTAAPTVALSVLLLATVAVAALAPRRMQLEADRVIDQALAASEAAEHIEHVFEDCRQRLTDYAATGQLSEVEKVRGLEKESSDDLVQIDALVIPDRGHLLIAEMERFTVVLRSELKQIHPAASLEAREAAIRRVLGTVLDSQLLSARREERELCIENLHAARVRGLEVTRRSQLGPVCLWAWVVPLAEYLPDSPSPAACGVS